MFQPRKAGRAVLYASLSLLITASAPASASARALGARATTVPAPYSYTPSQDWLGIDGQWSAFFIQVGSPPQFLRVVPSTASQQIWVPDVDACRGDGVPACVESRGGSFNFSQSSSWDENGWYRFWIEENLGYGGTDLDKLHFGYDDITLAEHDGNGPSIANTTVGSFVDEQYYLGIFGLHPKPTNFSQFTNPSPSHMTYLKEQNKIPSLSYGYTAGAQYRFTKVLGSLTLGGYDAERFVPTNVTYSFAPDNARDLVVFLQSITVSDSTQQDTILSSQSLNMFIDSTVSQLWLPVEVCEQFEKVFGLTYDETTELYLLNDTQHEILKQQDASVTFTIGPSASGGSTTEIVLPYAAFDLEAKSPYRGLQNDTAYFPLRRAQNDTQYVLGRTFLQEAYIIVDHERQNFSINPIQWGEAAPGSRIVAIPALSQQEPPETTGGSSLATAAIVGIAVGVGAVAVIAAVVVYIIVSRRKRRRQAEEQKRLEEERKAAAVTDTDSERSADTPEPDVNADTPAADENGGSNVFPKAELPADEYRYEMPTEEDFKVPEIVLSDGTTDTLSPVEIHEVENLEREIFEMEGDMPARSEAGGRELTEKQAMMIREQRYNGVDPEPIPSPNTPTGTEGGISPTSITSRQPRRIDPADVAMITGTSTNLSLSPSSAQRSEGSTNGSLPISPLTPSGRGGVTLEETILSPLSPYQSDRSDGSRTMTMTSSLDTSPDRRRFSFEPPTDEEHHSA